MLVLVVVGVLAFFCFVVMRFVDSPELRFLCSSINSATHDQRIDARIERYSFHSPSQSPIASSQSRISVSAMIACIGETYPEGSTRHLTENSFMAVPLTACVNYVNQTLGAAIERRRPDLLPSLWSTLRDSCGDVAVYECIDEIHSGSKLWGFLYLWVTGGQVLVLGCRSKSTTFRDSSESEGGASSNWKSNNCSDLDSNPSSEDAY